MTYEINTLPPIKWEKTKWVKPSQEVIDNNPDIDVRPDWEYIGRVFSRPCILKARIKKLVLISDKTQEKIDKGEIDDVLPYVMNEAYAEVQWNSDAYIPEELLEHNKITKCVYDCGFFHTARREFDESGKIKEPLLYGFQNIPWFAFTDEKRLSLPENFKPFNNPIYSDEELLSYEDEYSLVYYEQRADIVMVLYDAQRLNGEGEVIPLEERLLIIGLSHFGTDKVEKLMRPVKAINYLNKRYFGEYVPIVRNGHCRLCKCTADQRFYIDYFEESFCAVAQYNNLYLNSGRFVFDGGFYMQLGLEGYEFFFSFTFYGFLGTVALKNTFQLTVHDEHIYSVLQEDPTDPTCIDSRISYHKPYQKVYENELLFDENGKPFFKITQIQGIVSREDWYILDHDTYYDYVSSNNFEHIIIVPTKKRVYYLRIGKYGIFEDLELISEEECESYREVVIHPHQWSSDMEITEYYNLDRTVFSRTNVFTKILNATDDYVGSIMSRTVNTVMTISGNERQLYTHSDISLSPYTTHGRQLQFLYENADRDIYVWQEITYNSVIAPTTESGEGVFIFCATRLKGEGNHTIKRYASIQGTLIKLDEQEFPNTYFYTIPMLSEVAYAYIERCYEWEYMPSTYRRYDSYYYWLDYIAEAPYKEHGKLIASDLNRYWLLKLKRLGVDPPVERWFLFCNKTLIDDDFKPTDTKWYHKI